MSESALCPVRRMLILGGGIAALGAPASCQSVLPTAGGSGASMAASGRISNIRRNAALSLLAPDTKAETAALEQARLMAAAGRMEHTAIAGRDFASRMKRNGIPAPAAENIAHGRMDLDRLFAIWMDSEGHRRNLLDARFSRFGLAYAEETGDTRYWSLVLSA